MRVYVATELRDLRGPAMAIALESLGHTSVTDPAAAEIILCADPRAAAIVKLANASGATAESHEAFLGKTPPGRALLRFGGFLSVVLDEVKGIGVGLDSPMTDAAADVPTMLAIVAQFVPTRKPLGLGNQLWSAASKLREKKQYDLALRTLEIAFRCGDDVASPDPLWLLQPDNSGLLLDRERARWFLERCLPEGVHNLLIHREAARLYTALGDDDAACVQLERFLDRGAFFIADVEVDPKLQRIRDQPAVVAAIKKARATLPRDPDGVLAPLLRSREACAKLFPAPFPREKPTSTAPTIAALYGRELPAPLMVWLACLDQWDIGHLEIYDWKGWNPGHSHRSWSPLAVPKDSENAFEWLFKLDDLADPTWKKRIADTTLNLVIAGVIPIGRTQWTGGEFGVHVDPTGAHDEVVLFDREKNRLAVVASGLDAFIAYQARASARGKRAPAAEVPEDLAPRVRFGAELSDGDYKPHGEGSYEPRSKVLDFIRRGTWIVDLLNGIPKLPRIVEDYVAHAGVGPDLDAIWDQPSVLSAAEGLYWLWHLYFVGEDALLEPLLARAAASPARYVRDAATLITKALAQPTNLGHVELAAQRAAFQKKLGKKKRPLDVPKAGKSTGGAAAPSKGALGPKKASAKKTAAKPASKPADQAPDSNGLRAAIKPLEAAFASFPWGKVKEADLIARIEEMPDTLADYFAAAERPEECGGGGEEFAMALLIRATLASPERTVKSAGQLALSKREVNVFYGDLEVPGDLPFDGLLIVLGDLIVDGVLSDTDDYAHLWVTGSLRARGIHCAHTAWVGGTLEADAIVLGRRGNVFAVGGVETPLAIRNDYEGAGFRGELRAEKHIDIAKDEDALSGIAKKFLNEEDDAVNLEAKALLAAAARGENVLAGG